MNNIIEILGEKKFNGSIQEPLKIPLYLNENKKDFFENNLFSNISEQEQYIKEKNSSSNFRIYGKLNPILNLRVRKNNVDYILNQQMFDFNYDNWNIIILKSKNIAGSEDINGNVIMHKGVKQISQDNIKLNLTKGLSAKIYNNDYLEDYITLYVPIGHNFQSGNKVNIISNVPDIIDDGIYYIKDIINNKIYLNVKKKNINQIIRLTQQIGGINFASDVANNIAQQDTSKTILNFTFPDVYISKVVELEKLEYYIKVLEVIDIIDGVDKCAFSNNYYQQDIYNFINNNIINIETYLNNLNEPLTDLYIGIIKKNELVINSNLEMFIDYTPNELGIEKINTIKPIKKGDIFYHSLCEYTTENLEEVEITKFKHGFYYEDVLFQYQPFYKFKIKLKSTYIEDSDNINVGPTYQKYSKQREKYIWRDIYDMGVMNELGEKVDYPFMNNCFYVYCDINFYLQPERKYILKYALNINDINSGDNNTNNGETLITDLINSLDVNFEIELNNNPYNEYIEPEC
jgi:hypothetical protein